MLHARAMGQEPARLCSNHTPGVIQTLVASFVPPPHRSSSLRWQHWLFFSPPTGLQIDLVLLIQILRERKKKRYHLMKFSPASLCFIPDALLGAAQTLLVTLSQRNRKQWMHWGMKECGFYSNDWGQKPTCGLLALRGTLTSTLSNSNKLTPLNT